MGFMKLKEFFYRRKLLSKNFFHNVYISDRILKKKILHWIFYLKRYKDVSIDKFEYLFSKYEEIVFPVKVYGINSHLTIKDSIGKEYYLIFDPYRWKEFDKYVIGIRSDSYDRDCGYHITPENDIVLRTRGILPLNEDGTNKDYWITFNYDLKSSTTKAVVATSNSAIEVSYPSQSDINDEKISEMLFDVANENKNVDNVFSIIAVLFKMTKGLNETHSLAIKSVDKGDKQILSEILLSNGIVEKYTFTKRSSETESCFHKLRPLKKIEEFISEYESRNE